MYRKCISPIPFFLLLLLLFVQCNRTDELRLAFQSPPETAKPGVYWYFMDGNLSKEEMTKDLESMVAVGINHVIFLEVGIGVPRGPVDFMSDEWQQLFVHAVREAERLGMRILMGAGPGWCGSGGPWVKPEQSMQHLVFSEVEVEGGGTIDQLLPVPDQRSTIWHTFRDPFYQDVVTYAIPSSAQPVISDINEKALYERDPYSSKPGVKAHLPSRATYPELDETTLLESGEVIDLSDQLQADGRLIWEAPEGQWTVVRMGIRVTGASTRPSPEPVIGLECNKMNAEDFAHHLKNYTDILLERTAPRKEGAGWTGFHIDSWESGAQNWTRGIVGEFKSRRGYDPEKYLISFTGRAVESVELTERFLWDWRKTCQELVLENHMAFALEYAHQHGLELTVEPYDMNPAGDLDLGSYADVIMAEFWSDQYGFPTAYAVLEATSISHLSGRPVVGAEVFTANHTEAWRQYPGSMKDQSDWALALGVNRFVYHTFAHKPLGDSLRPGMSMGSIGIHWDRGQTFWPLVGDYHAYISRCSHMMQQGQAVSDILYLTPEGAPMVFTPPVDALEANGTIPDKKAYGFDACSPIQLMERAEVREGKICFPGASSYEIMVLPTMRTMTPELLGKITQLVDAGARIIGSPPLKSPSLTGYPACDEGVVRLATRYWGGLEIPEKLTVVKQGAGRIYWGGDLCVSYTDSTLYPSYASTEKILKELGIKEDFLSDNNTIRYGHRQDGGLEIYFVANRTDQYQKTTCRFRATGKPELWVPVTGEFRAIPHYSVEKDQTVIDLAFHPHESFFVVFFRTGTHRPSEITGENFPAFKEVQEIAGSWQVEFDPRFGGPDNILFDSLQDWTIHEEPGIRYYSGLATYTTTFVLDELENADYYLDLGEVHDLAHVVLNGKDLGGVWTAPWQVGITDAVETGENELVITIANRWINRLLGDQLDPDPQGRTIRFENGLLGGRDYPMGQYTFTLPQALRGFTFTEPLSAGLLGPVKIRCLKP